MENEDGIYIGEADYATPQGRGCYIFKNDGQSWIGYFEKGEKGNYGKFYNKDGQLIYEGEYSHGEKNMKVSLLKIKKKEREFFIGMKKLGGKEHG